MKGETCPQEVLVAASGSPHDIDNTHPCRYVLNQLSLMVFCYGHREVYGLYLLAGNLGTSEEPIIPCTAKIPKLLLYFEAQNSTHWYLKDMLNPLIFLQKHLLINFKENILKVNMGSSYVSLYPVQGWSCLHHGFSRGSRCV